MGGPGRQLRKIDRELASLVQAIRTTGLSEALGCELSRCERRKAELESQLLGLERVGQPSDYLPADKQISEALNGFRCLLESGTIQEKRTVIGDNIEKIVVRPSGEALLKVNPQGLLPDCPLGWCRERDLNPQEL